MKYEIDSGSFFDTNATNIYLKNSAISKARDLIHSTAMKMKEMISNGDIAEAECPVTHRFSKGIYLREIFMPAGTRIIGKIHATEHFNVLLTGRVTVLTPEGKEEITAPYTFVSKAGVQKVVSVHEDCIWQTLHVTDKTSIDEIESEVIAKDYDSLKTDGLLKTLEGVNV